MIEPKKIIVWGGIAIIIGVLARVYFLQVSHQLSFHDTFIWNLLFIGGGVIVLGILSFKHFSPRPLLENWKHWVGFGLIVVIGLLARTLCWDHFPPENGQLIEEPQTAILALDSIMYSRLDVVYPLTTLLAETGLRLFGRSMDALRFPFLAWGCLSVFMFFVAARLFFRKFEAAFAASLLFASCAFLAGSSRIAMETMAPMTTLTIALAAVFYACTKRTYSSFFMAGTALGLLLLEFVSFKLMAVMLGGFLFLFFFQKQRDVYCHTTPGRYHYTNWLPYIPHFLCLFGGIVLILMPLLLVGSSTVTHAFLENILRHQQGFEQRLPQLSWLTLLGQQIVKIKLTAACVFLNGGGANDILPSTHGLIEFFTGLVGMLAIGFCAYSAKRSPAKLLPVLSILLTVILSGVLVLNPSRYRLIPIIPFYFLGIGLVIDDGLMFWRRHQKIVQIAVMILVSILTTLNLYDFWGVALTNDNVRQQFYDFNLILALKFQEIQKDDPQTMIYVLGTKDFLGRPNDYAFLYDHTHVQVIASYENIIGKQGYFITYDTFIPALEDISAWAACEQWPTEYQRNTVLLCQMKPESP